MLLLQSTYLGIFLIFKSFKCNLKKKCHCALVFTDFYEVNLGLTYILFIIF